MYRLGIDLGGTNIVAGVVDENYKIVAKASCKTNVPRPESDICDSMAEVAVKACEKAGITMDEVESIGIGVPGAVNPKTGVIEYSANLHFHNWEVSKMMNERLGKKVLIENDANAAALGEYLAGSAKGAKNAIAITLGTGVGGGIIINGKIYSGSNFAGAELGHMVIVKDGKQCGCGRKGCWEAYSSATGLINLTKEKILSEKLDYSFMLNKICGGDINKVNGKTAFRQVWSTSSTSSSPMCSASAAASPTRERICSVPSERSSRKSATPSTTTSRHSFASALSAMTPVSSAPRSWINSSLAFIGADPKISRVSSSFIIFLEKS